MPAWEGIISSVNPDGRVEVVFLPQCPGISGAPDLGICHPATPGSTVTLEAMNRADASVGDRVRVASEGWVLAKNAACLLGIPMFGLLSGLTLGILLYRQAVFHWIGVGALAMVAPLLGILLGTRCYRRVSADHHPVVTHILEKEVGAACLPSGPEGSPICQGCAGKPN